MRIQRLQHAVDGGLDQLLFVGLFHVVAAYAVENVPEEIKLLVDLDIPAACGRRLQGMVEPGAHQGAECHERQVADEIGQFHFLRAS